jgi:hypothetical protein
MKKIILQLLSVICLSTIASAQSNNNSSGQVPINADQSGTPPPVQNTPVTPQRVAPPNNKVMLRAQTDSMDSQRKTVPPSSQKVYVDSSRYIIYQGDTETAPKPKRQ